MYQRILVALDHSPWSNYGVDLALGLAARFGARLLGIHVYAARLHDRRFRQMEPGLPERYQSQVELERLRGTHDDLITRGLALISDSYLEVMAEKCRARGLPLECQAPEGKNFEMIVRAARESQADLVVLGAWGLGRIGDKGYGSEARAGIGSVCQRTVRQTRCDVLVAKAGAPLEGGGILVGVDGSANSVGAVRKAVGLSKAFEMSLEGIAVFDPLFHKVAFQGLAGVLSAQAAQVFKFQEQEKLHDELIDDGLARIYAQDLERVSLLAQGEGVAMRTTLLAGRPHLKIAEHVEKTRPALLVVGRYGAHRSQGLDIGSVTENLLRLAETNILIVGEPGDGQAGLPELTRPVEAPLPWDPEAEARLDNVPPFARGMARKGIEDYARQHGYPRITLDVYHQARRKYGMGSNE
ncbi:MAG: universal stress protein [Chloroflexota bacterium]